MSDLSETEKPVSAAPAKETWPKVIKLSRPVKSNGVEIDTIIVREPLGRDWKRWCNRPDSPARTMGLLVDLTQLDETVFDDLALADHVQLIGVATGFFGQYQPEETGIMKLLMTSPSFTDGFKEMLMS